MTKLITSIVVSVTFVFALIVFFIQRNISPKEQFLNTLDSEPRVVLEDFSVFRYIDQKVDSTFSAKLGHFIEPNIIETYASVRGVRYKEKNTVESLRSESATGYLIADSMNELLSEKGAEISRAEVEDQVQISFGEHTMHTEFAEYIASKNMISSVEEVRVDGPNRTLFGKDGFRYDLKNEVLEMGGDVSGVMIPDNKDKK